MKKLLLSGWLCFALLSFANAQYVAERSGYEGDYFSLEGALDLFKDSKNLNQFERKLNREDNWVNNLDLNYDGQIDYIRVEHNRSGNFHAIVLQAILSSWEVQDVAVIEIEKRGRYDAVLQIVGDADLYGEEVIVESRQYDNGYASNVSYRGYDNVYYWQPVQYIFAPRYVVYVSPYRWSYYPTWWSPWRQCGWNTFYPRVVHYHNYYQVVNVHRVVNVHNYYYQSRSSCNRVGRRAAQVRKQHGHSYAYKNVRKKNDKNYTATSGSRQTSRPARGTNTRISTNKKPAVGRQVSPGKRPTRVSGKQPISQAPRNTRSKPIRSKPAIKPTSKKPTRTTSTSRPAVSNRGRSVAPTRGGHRTSTATSRPGRSTSAAKPSRSNSSAKPTKSTSRAKPSGSTSRAKPSRSTSAAKPSRTSSSAKPTRSTSRAKPSGTSRGTYSPSRSGQRSSTAVKKPARNATSSSRSSSSRQRASSSSTSRQKNSAPKRATPKSKSGSQRKSKG